MSTESNRDDMVLVGRVIRPHGLRGTVVVDVVTDRPESRFRPGAALATRDGGTLTVKRFEPTARSPLLTFEEVDGRDEAEALRGESLYIALEQRRGLDEDEFWPEELVGMEVVDEGGIALGSVVGVEAGVGQDRLRVAAGSQEILVPFVAELVPEVDREGNRLVVSLPEGFRD